MVNLLLAAAAILVIWFVLAIVVATGFAIGMTIIARELFRAREED